jgi:hypothetical protein
MAFVLKNPPEFTVEINQWTRETDADGAEMAKDIEKLLNNDFYLKTELERMDHVALAVLPASGWTGSSAPYIQTVSVEGAKEDRDARLVSVLADGASLEVQKAYMKAFSLISSGTGVLGEGVATFKVYKKPATDITVGLLGVM